MSVFISTDNTILVFSELPCQGREFIHYIFHRKKYRNSTEHCVLPAAHSQRVADESYRSEPEKSKNNFSYH